jgi:hypothetical protein
MQGLDLDGLLSVPFVLHDLVKEIAGQARNDAGGIMAGLTTSPVIAGFTSPVIAGLTRNLGGAQAS